MLWFALYPPRLSLEAWQATLDEAQRGQPAALLAGHVVHTVTPAAARAGVQPGLKRATALALVPDLLLAQADAERDHQALQALVHVALAFTPAVCTEGPAVLLEVAASLRLFGGPQALLQRLQAALAPLGHQVHIASAPTAQAAALLARWRADLAWGPHSTSLPQVQRLLAPAPVALLAAGQAHALGLQGMGLHRLRDLHGLPRDGLTRRFGAALLDELDRACGRRPDPRVWCTLPDAFASRLELATRADHTQQLLHAARLLLARLVAWAQARQCRVAAFTLEMHHERRHRHDDTTPAQTCLRVELAQPALDPAHLQLLLRERLARVQLAAPTLDLTLRCQDVVQREAPNAELFPTRQSDDEGLLRLLERLRARLGPDQVLCLQPMADYRPEKSTCERPALGWAGVDTLGGVAGSPSLAPVMAAVPAAEAASPVARVAEEGPPAAEGPASALMAPDDLPGPPLPLAHPAWLLPEPQPLAQREGLPLLGGRVLQLVAGPERVETAWWDGDPVLRDYFIAQAEGGALVWVFRARVPRTDTTGPLWHLHGRFG